jgi:hypothetical protein
LVKRDAAFWRGFKAKQARERRMLFLFHNEFSTNRLIAKSGFPIAAKQFVRQPFDDNRYRQWTEITE